MITIKEKMALWGGVVLVIAGMATLLLNKHHVAQTICSTNCANVQHTNHIFIPLGVGLCGLGIMVAVIAIGAMLTRRTKNSSSS